MNTIYITAQDNARLRRLLLLSPFTDPRQRERELLRRELDRAAIVPDSHGQPEAVRLGVHFEYEDLAVGAVEIGCLCLPGDEETTPNGISVLSRFGAAVIGCCVGNEIWWAEPDRSRRIRIRRIGVSSADSVNSGIGFDEPPRELIIDEPQRADGRSELEPAR